MESLRPFPEVQESKRGNRQEEPHLRVGVLLDTLRPERWIKDTLEELRDSERIDLTLIWVPGGSASNGIRRRTDVRSRGWIAVDRALRNQTEDVTAHVPIDLREYSSEVIPLSDDVARNFREIKASHLDVIVNLGGSECASQVAGEDNSAEVASQGIWAFDELGDFSRWIGCSDLHCETCSQDTHVGTTAIRVQSGPAPGKVLRKVRFAGPLTSPANFVDAQLSRRPRLLVESLLGRRDESEVDVDEAQSNGAGHRSPLRLAATAVREGARRALKRVVGRDQWCIGLREVDGRRSSLTDLTGFKLLQPPRDRFYADPFIFQNDGKHYVFFEEYSFEAGKGVISCAEIHADGTFRAARVVLEREYHLSYPFVFRHGRDIFMVPESTGAERLEVFKACEFPGRWEPFTVLMTGITAYDPTLFEFEGKYWLFASGVQSRAGRNDELWLFWADDPFGTWHPHEQNPVVTDVRRARPAGSLFSHAGVLYRPAQDCSRTYGGAITFNRVEELATSRYREVPTVRIEPDWLPGADGTHTINRDGRYEVVDGRMFVPSWSRQKPRAA